MKGEQEPMATNGDGSETAPRWVERHPRLALGIALGVLALMIGVTVLIKRASDQQLASNFQTRWAAWFKYLSTDPSKLELLEPPPFITNDKGFWTANPTAIGVNSEGFRSPEFDEPAGGRPTILFAGASYTWGYSAEPLSNSFVDLVRDAGYRTLNLGIPASQSFLQADIAEYYIPELKPDVVGFMFALDNRIFHRLHLQPGHPFYYVTSAGWLNGYRADGTPLSLEEAHRYNLELVSNPRPAPDPDEAEAITRDAIARIRAAADLVGAEVLIYVIPINPDTDYHGIVNQAVHRFSDLDLLVPAGLTKDHYVFKPDPHFNNEGHRLYADYVVETLQERGYAPNPEHPVEPYPYLPGRVVDFERFRTHFGLDDEQAGEVEALLNGLKDRFVTLYRTAPDQGGPAPLDYLVTMLRDTVQEPAAAQAIFGQYAEQTPAPGRQQSYAEVFMAEEQEARNGLMAVLRPTQRYWAAEFPVHSLRDVITGHDPLAAFIEAGTEQPEELRGRGPLTFEQLSRRLRLAPEIETPVRQLINGFKQDRAALLTRSGAEGAAAPVDYLAHLLVENDPQAPALFLEYTETTVPDGDEATFSALMEAMEQEAAAALMARLDRSQQVLYGTMAIPSLADVDTGFDPVGEAIAEAVARLDGDG